MAKGKHTVKQNETLSNVAVEHYGHVDYWKGLVKANKDIIKKYDFNSGYVLINPGQQLALPSDSDVKSYTDNINEQISLAGVDHVTLDF
jgi:LysM repeat protein